ncbi:unnamed protein product [Rotaria sordida]|uniref:Uncharacterized protein n=1 Tax=Rotaria sordida TaxID=392033 RepID=A0A818J1T0_9BILA|nr:unnamed protein product [Rotaria sordida]CAF3536642.1 unnamed protein product [Rotaria sordida]CAF3604478.1 unnamed protein product [Rotaria sordida]CAF3723698.1 unnamed protein product [Rotaria sordida]
MSHNRESSIAYFISITHCQRDDAIQYLEKTQWRLDQSLNLFFEQDLKQKKSNIHSKCIVAPYQQYENKPNARAFDLVPLLPRSSPKTIIIPTMIEFQRFIESFNIDKTNLLENSSKMMNLAMKYATYKEVNIPSNQIEHWKIHLKVDYTRLQTLLDNDMCAPLVWIEHFEHLLNGNIDQLFDCDYMFTISD